jgi:hypothetical protein
MTQVRFGSLVAAWLLFVAALASPASAQPVSPSLYTGFGLGTNLGGLVGVGTEVQVGDYLSASVAVGTWPEAMRTEDLRGPSPFDFDVGVKVYPFKTRNWVYAGLNYGVIEEEIISTSAPFPSPRSSTGSAPLLTETNRLTKTRGFSFSLGARTPSWNRLYASTFLGVTANGDVNTLSVFDTDAFFPRFGLMIGIEIW